MAPASSASSASEGADDTVYQAKLASSLAGLPVRQGQQQPHAGGAQQNGQDKDSSNGNKDPSQLQDTLDLAVSLVSARSRCSVSPPDDELVVGRSPRNRENRQLTHRRPRWTAVDLVTVGSSDLHSRRTLPAKPTSLP